ncbi:hypothetical protein [Actinacidiphila soli]|uniref:hypothetical protein n=1 Tax=Actinacidiphila soli TaxID=2487275 RepID=UPI000FCC97AF|nr:hypothetical protein [Actinacidiphila soli]
MNGGQTLAALLARLEERQAQIAAQAEAARAKIAELTALLGELVRAAEHLTITRKTLLELPDEPPPAPSPVLPDHPAYQQIMAVFAQADGPLRAREVCEAMDLPILPKHTEGIRSKLKRLADRGILAETEPGLFTQPRP